MVVHIMGMFISISHVPLAEPIQDDLWRRNYDTIKGLLVHAQDFNPHYPTSIAYRPLPRPALEAFLVQRGLYTNKAKPTDFFHPGLLNKLYFRLNSIVCKDPKHVSPRSVVVRFSWC